MALVTSLYEATLYYLLISATVYEPGMTEFQALSQKAMEFIGWSTTALALLGLADTLIGNVGKFTKR